MIRMLSLNITIPYAGNRLSYQAGEPSHLVAARQAHFKR